MSKKILAPIQNTYSSPYFRIVVPYKYLPSNIHIDFYRFKINKYKSRPFNSNLSFVDRATGLGFDYLKWLESFYFTTKETSYDAVWLSRSLLSYKNKLELRLQNVIYDFDDAVWLGEAAYCFEYYCQKALVVFAGNNFLANQASKFSKRVYLVPTSVDINVYKSNNTKGNSSDTFSIGWIGSSSAFKYLQLIEKELLVFLEKHKEAKLIVVADRFPYELKSIGKHLKFIKWSIETDVSLINAFTVGIMPLQNGDWERGKCSLKTLQYMACEIPTIVSDVGMNKEIISHTTKYGAFGRAIKDDEWVDCLEYYYQLNSEALVKEGKIGREVIKDFYSAEMISPIITRHLNEYL